MKLSEAIRKGCELVPVQAHDNFFNRDERGQVIAACALGTAAIAIHGNVEWCHPQSTIEQGTRIDIYQKRRRFHLIKIVGSKLNDNWKWSREQIADFLERNGY